MSYIIFPEGPGQRDAEWPRGMVWSTLEDGVHWGCMKRRQEDGTVEVWVRRRKLGENGTWLLNLQDNGKELWRWKPTGRSFLDIAPTFTIPGSYGRP